MTCASTEGAQAVFVGQPGLSGFAVDGETGVRRVLELLQDEVTRALALPGCTGSPRPRPAGVPSSGRPL